MWALLNTRYTLTPDTLTLVCGPRRETRPTTEIQAVAPVRGRVDGMALSTSGFLLTFSNSKTLFISPLEPARFLAELSRVAPQVQIID
ncbi:PH domain-containing protein [Acidovorax delafieldii]